MGNTPTEPKIKSKVWQKSTASLYSLERLSNVQGNIHIQGIFTFYFHCTNLKSMNSEDYSPSVTIQKMLWEMFTDAGQVSGG